MSMIETERRKTEKINGVLYDMSPAPGYKHGIINGNIYHIVRSGLKNSLCLAFIENLDFKFHGEVNDDYLCPDIMVICERTHLKGGTYSGVPKFIVETLSPSTAKRDRLEKKEIYEKAGVEEYWIVSPHGAVEIYYLQENKYVLEQSYILQNDRDDQEYNAEVKISVRAFPHIQISLGEIFEGIEE